jgi:photosystem II stability/assembly factor-like uncharacterized protein
VTQGAQTSFFSYCRDDSQFALRVGEDLKAAGANVWLDQLDIVPGQRWARAVQDALTNCHRLLVILSPSSVNSTNVEDEITFALEEHKTVIPVLYRDCKVPFQLRPFQYVDFRSDYARGLKTLLKTLGVEQQAVAAGGAVVSAVPKESQTDVSDADERKRAAEQALEEERERAEEERLEEKRKQAAERARVEEEHRRAAQEAQLEEERRNAAAEAERTTPESEQAQQTTQQKSLITSWIGAWSDQKFAGALILIVAVSSWLIFHTLPRAPQKPSTRTTDTEPWIVRNSGAGEDIYSIFGTSDGNRLWATASTGTILKSDDGGEQWIALKIPFNDDFGPTLRALFSIFGTSNGQRLWIVGDQERILESDDGGENWNERNSAHDPDMFDRAFHALFSIRGTSDCERLWAVGAWGTILESDDGGKHWNEANSGLSYSPNTNFQGALYSISVVNNGQRLWVVGNPGIILESDDGGKHWIARNSGTRQALYSIFATSEGNGLWVVGSRGTILKSDDGTHWIARNSGTSEDLHSIYGESDGKRLWAVGDNGTILGSDDGGEHWIARSSGTRVDFRSIFGTSNVKRLWAVGHQGTILESTVR